MAAQGTSQGEWRVTAQVNANSATENPVNCVRFDAFEELVWVGSTTGKVSSYVPANHHPRYSAFVVSKISPIHAIEPTHSMIFSLSDTELRMNTRQGVPVGKFTSPAMTKMTACRRLPNNSHFVMGGRQKKLLQYDYVHEKEIRTADIAENGAVIIRDNGTCAFTADESGNVHQRSLTSLDVIHSFPCHGEKILDFDVQGNLMITCGVSANFSRMKSTDQFIKVYDVRNQKALVPIGLQMPPKFVRFIPSYTERVCIVYQMPGAPNLPKDWLHPAGIKMFDLNSPNSSSTCQFQVETSTIAAFDISSSKSFISVGNVSGFVSLHSHRDRPLVNENSAKTMYIAPPAQPPVSFSIDDTSQPFGQIPLPFPVEPLVSDWPTEYTGIVYRRMKPHADYTNAKAVHYATQIKNIRCTTKLKRHNIVPYFLDDSEWFRDDQGAPEVAVGDSESVGAAMSPGGTPSEPGRLRVMKLYRKCPKSSAPPAFPHRQAQLPEDVTWNVIRHITMESTFDMNLLANPVVHLFYAFSPLRALVLRHICQEDNCLTCELHFLFTAFQNSAASRTQFTTTNLAWSLARKGVSLASSRNVFHVVQAIFELLAREVIQIQKEDETTLSSRMEHVTKCQNCGARQTEKVEQEAVIQMEYHGGESSFTRMIERAVHWRHGNENGREEAICEDCGVMSPMKSTRLVRQLSPLLLINTNPTSTGYAPFWRRNLSKFEKKPAEKQNEETQWNPDSNFEKNRPCRWGANCRSKKCQFSHGSLDLSNEQADLLKHVDFPGWRHYLPKRIAVQIYDGIAHFSDISSLPEYDEPTAEIYELDAMVDMISNGSVSPEWTHPVTLIRESPVASTAWTLINELLVSRLHDHEARRLDSQWKLPLIVAYKKRGFERNIVSEKVPEEWFFTEKNLSEKGAESPAIRSIEELPGNGDIVGIDCEFIKIRTNLLDFNGGQVEIKEIGRASCVNESGEKIIFDDHVTLAPGFEVLDYLTKYSGIVEDHLNPTTSDKYLTSHKRLMLRMHVLVQRGVVFVGHALHNDFTVLNVHIPEPQVIDTVNLLRSDDRLLSLAFISKHLLGEEIQLNSHDSVIDAQYALKIYRKYVEIKESGGLDDEKRRLYAIMLHENVNKASPLCISTKRKDKEENDSAPKSC